MSDFNRDLATRLVREAREKVPTLSWADRYPWEDEHGDGPFAPPDECRGCGGGLWPENRMIADGCPCNSPRGINHARVPKNTCTCQECDPEQTGSTRYPSASSWRDLLEFEQRCALADQLEVALQETEQLTKERDREADRAKYHSEMSERLGLDIARMRDERDAYRKAKAENDERFMIERDEARAECGRLRETLDREFSIGAEYQRLWATACAERDVWSGKACEEEQQAGNGPCGACRYCLPGMLIEALSELDLLRPVAEAAKRWRRCDETPLQPKPGEVFTLKDCNHDDLADAVDALIAAEAKETV